jgi:hypothetical protein
VASGADAIFRIFQKSKTSNLPGFSVFLFCCFTKGELFGNRSVPQRRVRMRGNVQAIFCRRRHPQRKPPLAKIRPGSPAPAIEPGTAAGPRSVSVAHFRPQLSVPALRCAFAVVPSTLIASSKAASVRHMRVVHFVCFVDCMFTLIGTSITYCQSGAAYVRYKIAAAKIRMPRKASTMTMAKASLRLRGDNLQSSSQ